MCTTAASRHKKASGLRPARRGSARIVFMAHIATYGELRAGEISRVSSWDMDEDALRIHGQGNKDRLVPIVHEALHDRLTALDGWAFRTTGPGSRSPRIGEQTPVRCPARGKDRAQPTPPLRDAGVRRDQRHPRRLATTQARQRCHDAGVRQGVSQAPAYCHTRCGLVPSRLIDPRG